MKTSDAGIALIREFEGCRLELYADAAGRPTIGIGHLVLPTERFDAPITEAQAEDLLRRDLMAAEMAVRNSVHVPLRQGAFDALVSFVYNLGPRHSIFDLVNAGDPMSAVDKMLEYRMAGGKALPGLLRRRCAEGALFLS